MYLQGNYAPVEHEVTAFDLPVIGEIPAELEGRYLRNGPNPITPPDEATHHWFMGDGMVHGVRLRGGKAEWYRNRYVASRSVNAARGLPDVPGRNWNNSPHGPNTNVGGFAGTTWAMVEAGGCPTELTYELETVAINDFFGTLPGAFTAHPKVDPATGEMHAMAYAWGNWLDHVQYIVVGTDGRVRRTVDIPMQQMSMLHDMSLTARYAVVYDLPCLVDLNVAFTGQFPFRWDPSGMSRIGLLPREGGADEIVWVDVPQCYSFHPLNSYDDADGNVVIDLCVYDSMFSTDVAGPFGSGFARLERWVANPTTRTCTTTVIDDGATEFPRHRGSLTARPYRYGYGTAPSLEPEWPTLKWDLHTGTRSEFHHGQGRGAGEPVFVGRQGATDEDDGWLITIVHDVANDAAELVILDAQDFSRDAVARVQLPQRVPYGFHGNWVSDRSVPPT